MLAPRTAPRPSHSIGNSMALLDRMVGPGPNRKHRCRPPTRLRNRTSSQHTPRPLAPTSPATARAQTAPA
eukprot:3090687-Lingulodinium_polyedra.AAC.1